MIARLCEQCGHGFWALTRRHRFCSRSCRSRAERVGLVAEKPTKAPRVKAPREPDPRRSYILAEWNGGRSLSAIAVELGISRERVGQLVGRLKGKSRTHLTVGEAARALGIGTYHVRRWIKLGQLSLVEGRLVTLADVQAALDAALSPRHCKTCGADFVSINPGRTHCESHLSSTGSQTKYAEWSAGRRSNHRRLTERWKAEHPELHRAMARRSRLVYKLVQSGVARETARALARAKHPDPQPQRVDEQRTA